MSMAANYKTTFCPRCKLQFSVEREQRRAQCPRCSQELTLTSAEYTRSAQAFPNAELFPVAPKEKP